VSSDQQFILALVAAAVPLIGAIGVLIGQVHSLRKEVDGRMTQLLALTETSALAKGRLKRTRVRVAKPPTQAAE
jgi:hypothetical protein